MKMQNGMKGVPASGNGEDGCSVMVPVVCVVTHFWVPAQNTKKKIQNIIKNHSSEKRMSKRPENGQKLVEEVQKYKD